MDSEQRSGSIERLLRTIRNRVKLIVLCVLVTTLVVYAASKHETRMYTATTSLVFNNSQVDQQAAGLQPVSGNSATAQQDTNVKLVELGDMAAGTATELGHGLTQQYVHKHLSVSAQGESNIVNVSATAASPRLAAAIANTYAKLFVTEQQESNHAYYAAALSLVDKQLSELSPAERAGPAGVELQGRAQSLGVLAELRNASVGVAQVATVPTSPSSPKVATNTALGALLGLLLGLGIAFLLEHVDRRIREPDELVATFGVPLLGVVPETASLSRRRRAGEVRRALPPSVAEAFNLIRARLRYFNVNRELRTLLVASAASGEGKTALASHLSGTAAAMGSRVLLLEADLRQPTIAEELGAQPGPGLTDVLIGSVPLDQATQTVEVDVPSAGDPAGRAMHVLVAGNVLPPNPGELIESAAMASLLEQAERTYDLVILDTPPLTSVSDAFSLLGKVDGVVIVSSVGHCRRDAARSLREILEGAGAPVLGVIANRVKDQRRSPYGSAYLPAKLPSHRSSRRSIPAHIAASPSEDSERLQSNPSVG
ncbi:MAG TPA: polysaccharide biosynthesis tyrosine autokinase [Solirubrobacteraceae bacterium]|nr:polysaccharide biosynthesis tyrosine autokinase [Solirubrobacteraceae bacterium]